MLYGRAVEDRCDIIDIMVVRCTSIDQAAPTNLWIQPGAKTLCWKTSAGWPLDFVGYVSDHPPPGPAVPGKMASELDVGLKSLLSRLSVECYRVLARHRLRLGPVVWSDPVPRAENGEQTSRNRHATSRLLSFIGPSVGVGLGDVLTEARLEADWPSWVSSLTRRYRHVRRFANRWAEIDQGAPTTSRSTPSAPVSEAGAARASSRRSIRRRFRAIVEVEGLTASCPSEGGASICPASGSESFSVPIGVAYRRRSGPEVTDNPHGRGCAWAAPMGRRLTAHVSADGLRQRWRCDRRRRAIRDPQVQPNVGAWDPRAQHVRPSARPLDR